jgi:hypothetical protein
MGEKRDDIWREMEENEIKGERIKWLIFKDFWNLFEPGEGD